MLRFAVLSVAWPVVAAFYAPRVAICPPQAVRLTHERSLKQQQQQQQRQGRRLPSQPAATAAHASLLLSSSSSTEPDQGSSRTSSNYQGGLAGEPKSTLGVVHSLLEPTLVEGLSGAVLKQSPSDFVVVELPLYGGTKFTPTDVDAPIPEDVRKPVVSKVWRHRHRPFSTLYGICGYTQHRSFMSLNSININSSTTRAYK